MDSVNISDHYRHYNNDNIYRGLYEHEISGTGGPFFSYIINTDSKITYIFSGFVNYPGRRKINLLKQIEILFKSIIIY